MIIEGSAKIITDGVFYNPRMRFCRDLDMNVFSVIKSNELLDALAASGVRGIRAMLEAGCKVVFNDKDKKAVKIIKRNLEINGLEAEVLNKDASLLMRERKFHHIDIDPFGSPSPFLDSACFSVKRYLSVTATDTSALCGSATRSGLKKYSAFAVKTDTFHETGLRMLVGFVVREATKYEKALYPAISWAKEHYYRIHFRVRKSTSLSGKVYDKVGYLAFCKKCLAKTATPIGEDLKPPCNCGNYSILGPLWIGELKDVEFTGEVVKKSEGKAKDFLLKIYGEVDVPYTYNLQYLAQRLNVRTPKTTYVVNKLVELGYKASKTHYCGFCIKTDADINTLKEILTLNS